ncbi:alpha/beta hydrolase [Brevundimonas sp.]|uniref:alpha/beta hydrolase n=1 Tax=Brevundimonas sp. TaxID=1871086 RepID=UPI001A301892|nr:alpha/beta hydrolase [Brevundimonas sp.]MBJ7486244.1 alpha/beta hydrolase [Brevundimonas sp.]
MRIDRRSLFGFAAAVTGGISAPSALAQMTPRPLLAPPDPTEVWKLWPDGAPGGERVTVTPVVTERSTDPAFHDRFAQYTTDPILTVMRPITPNGASMVLIPGGGYRWSVVDKEGFDVARVFAEAGVTCFVLRYRLPADGWAAGAEAPLQDAQRAVRMVRSRAAEFGLDPARVAVLGASAGGHLAGWATAEATAAYAPVDAHDAVSLRPDFSILMYPVATMADPFVHAGSREQLLGAAPSAERIKAYSLEEMDWSGAPPVWLIHAIDDASVVVENSLNLLSALRRAKVPAEAHLYEEGGHGFGVRLIAGKPADTWPEIALRFGRRHGWVA